MGPLAREGHGDLYCQGDWMMIMIDKDGNKDDR